MTASDLNSRTPAGVLAYCEYLMGKGYATSAQVNPWRTAIQKVFETVDPQGWEQLDLTNIDMDEYLARFQTLAGAQYKAESIAAYKRRIKNAMDAHEHYLSEGKPPSFQQRGPRAKPEDKTARVVSLEQKDTTQAVKTPIGAAVGMTDFPYPLGDGRMVTLTLPSRLKGDDVTRLCAFIRTLQDDSPEPKQLPRHAGEEPQAA
jgi:hypothetical protein